MNLAMQHPVAYSFYMDSPRLRFSLPWPSNPFQYPSHSQQYYSSSYQLSPSLTPISYPLPFILSHPVRAPNPPPKPMQSYSSYTNTRYNHLKQSTSHMSRHRSMDPSLHSQHYSISNHQYQPSKATSISDLHQLSNQNSTHLLKAHSWHTMNHIHQPNKNINFAKEIPLIHDKQHNHFYSPKQKKKIHKLQLSPLSPIQKQLPETGIVRISTLDEMPTIHNPIYRENIGTSNIHDNNNNNNNKNKNKSRQKKSNNKSSSTSPSTNSSHSSFQKLLNGTLLHDPLLTAAMEDFRQLHRTSSQSTPLTFCKPIHDIDNEMRPTRPLSMFNWFHCGVTNPLPATFQPNKFKTNDIDNEYDKALVKENIYASDIDVHIPISNDKNFLNDQSMMTDYFSDCKQTTHSSSILSDFSRLFTRFGNHKHEQKSKLKRKLHKNNNHNNSRCSIM
ncbi:unnamed protein product [Rotaria magnacalcarata]|uniref:Uncharacterized protein n=1 Tax=Rotaria magnacalcarata TaxID=392030 RepID=A0A819LED3_9BILA|nr:unnamed protein product [Rotaria magnacalcarata]